MDTAKTVAIANGDKHPFICEAPRYPKSFCQEGWTLHMKSRSCFKIPKVTESISHELAMTRCRELESSLASINDESEWNLVRSMFSVF